jgi:hypothetical protein
MNLVSQGEHINPDHWDSNWRNDDSYVLSITGSKFYCFIFICLEFHLCFLSFVLELSHY